MLKSPKLSYTTKQTIIYIIYNFTPKPDLNYLLRDMLVLKQLGQYFVYAPNTKNCHM